MKKLVYFAIAAVAGMSFVACEPVLIKGPEASKAVAASDIQSAFVIDGQYADAACTQAQADGNFIKYHTSPARTVQISNLKADGSKNLLATGASGVFNITPRRGQDSNQYFTVSTINPDATIVSFDSNVNVYVPADLAPEVKVLTGESGVKAWKWYAVDGACWGNAGWNAGKAASPTDLPGKWWGCTPDQLETEQVQHSGGVVYGYGSDDAYMVFNSIDGTVTSYKADGTPIASSPYEVNDFQMNPEVYSKGTINTPGETSGILFPFAINTGGAINTTYEIMWLDGTMLSLVGNYAGSGDWGECTWWRFKPVE